MAQNVFGNVKRYFKGALLSGILTLVYVALKVRLLLDDVKGTPISSVLGFERIFRISAFSDGKWGRNNGL